MRYFKHGHKRGAGDQTYQEALGAVPPDTHNSPALSKRGFPDSSIWDIKLQRR